MVAEKAIIVAHNSTKNEPLTYFENTNAVSGCIRSNSNGDRGLVENVMYQNPGRFSSVILHAPITIKGEFLLCCRDRLNPYYTKKKKS